MQVSDGRRARARRGGPRRPTSSTSPTCARSCARPRTRSSAAEDGHRGAARAARATSAAGRRSSRIAEGGASDSPLARSGRRRSVSCGLQLAARPRRVGARGRAVLALLGVLDADAVALVLVDQADVLLLDRADADEVRRRLGAPLLELGDRALVDLLAGEAQLELAAIPSAPRSGSSRPGPASGSPGSHHSTRVRADRDVERLAGAGLQDAADAARRRTRRRA